MFKPRVPFPVKERPGGYEPWRDAAPPRRDSWRPLIFAALLIVFLLCGVTWAVMALTAGGDEPIAAAMPTAFILPTEPETTPEVTPEITAPVETTAEITPETTAPPEETSEPTPPDLEPTLPFKVYTPTPEVAAPVMAVLPTYTFYPTYTDQPRMVIHDTVVVTSAPVIIHEPIYIEVTSPPVIIYVTVIVDGENETMPPVFTSMPVGTRASITPTPTATATVTLTLTPTFTPTPTATDTPPPEITPEITPEG